MKRTGVAAVLWLLLMVVGLDAGAAGAPAQEEPPPVAIAARESYTLRLNGADATVSIPLVVDEARAALGEVTGSLTGVDDARVDDLEPFFTVGLDDDGLIRITVRRIDGAYPIPATYQLLVAVQWAPVLEDGSEQANLEVPVVEETEVVVAVVVPSAVMSATPSLRVRRIVDCPLELFCVGETRDRPEALVVRETSGVAPTGIVTAQVIDRNRLDDDPPDVDLTLADARSIDPGGSEAMVYAVSGDLDVGSTDAVVEFAAPGATARTTVALTVDRRQGGATYACLVIVGLVAGWFARNRLIAPLDRADVELEYRKERAAIEKSTAGAADSTFRAGLIGVLTTLDQKFVDPQPTLDEQKTAIQTAHTAAQKLADDLAISKKTAVEAWNQLAETLDEIAAVSPLTPAVAGPRAALEPIKALIERGAPTQALAALSNAHERATQSILATAKKFAASLHVAYGSMQRSRAPMLPSDAVERLDPGAVAQATARVEAATKLDDLATTMAPLLGHRNLLLDALRDIHAVGAEVERQIPRGKDPDLVPSLAALKGVLKTGEDLAATSLAAHRAATAIMKTLESVSGTSPVPGVSEAINDGRYWDALDRLAGRATDPAADDARRLGARIALAEDADGAAATTGSKMVLADGDAGVPTPPPGGWSTTSVRVARWVLGLFATGLLLGVAYVVLPSVLTGTRIQQIGVLLWAFTVLPTYEGLLSEARKIAPGPR